MVCSDIFHMIAFAKGFIFIKNIHFYMKKIHVMKRKKLQISSCRFILITQTPFSLPIGSYTSYSYQQFIFNHIEYLTSKLIKKIGHNCFYFMCKTTRNYYYRTILNRASTTSKALDLSQILMNFLFNPTFSGNN